MSEIPAHMAEMAKIYGHFSPEWYWESTCVNCTKPIYRYEMDVVVEWRHFDHTRNCVQSPVAVPVDDIPRGKRNA